MADHSARDHAAWSASASDRRWACAGSLAMELRFPNDKESEAAAWGTACHQLSEKCLRGNFDAVTLIDTIEKTKSHTFSVDDEMAETAQVYVDYVRTASKGKKLLIEQNFSLASLKPPIPGGGTGDAVILGKNDIEIVDLKGGRGIVVEALGNKQLRTYALGAILANPGTWMRVTVTIVQPRAPHADGRIRSETFSTIDLFDWTVDLLAAMNEAHLATQRCDPNPSQEFADKWLSAGSHCTFCKAKATCPALTKKALTEAKVIFAPEGVKAPPPPETLEVHQIVRILDHADMISNWLNAVRAHAQDMAESGIEVTDGASTYGLTPKQAMRKWSEGGEIITALALRTDRDMADFYQDPKPMSPAQVEKFLGKEGYAKIRDLVVQESSGFNLTRLDKTTREIASSPAKTLFDAH